MSAILEMKHITKSYGGNLANDRISISLNEGEVLAVIGENGAGKSTLMKVLYGMEQPDSGKILIRGKTCAMRSPQDAMRQGIGMVQQHFMLLDSCTVAENIVYGCEPRKHGLFFDRKQAVRNTKELCETFGLQIDPKAKVSQLPVGMQQRIEILKVLYQDARIIIFDEPSAVLTPLEVEELLATIRKLARMGKSIIIITHKLNEVMAVSDRIMVMRGGKYIAEKKRQETSVEELSYLMVGRRMIDRKIEPAQAGEKVLEVTGLVKSGQKGARNVLDNLSLHVNAGEIVGIAGVSGNGQSELIEALTGLTQVDDGHIYLCGQEVTNRWPGAVRKAGMACIPEDRFRTGCAREADLKETAIMGHHRSAALSAKGILREKQCRAFALKLLDKYDVRYAGLDQKAGELSGGNIQKLIVAREVEEDSPCLIAAEPTRGVDIGAMEHIHGQLFSRRAKGGAVLLVSSELTEILSLSDRIYVLYEGRIAGEFTRETANEEKIGMLMLGGNENG